MDVGDKVYRTGQSVRWGIITRLFRGRPNWYQQDKAYADVDWYAPRRRGGRGFHRSTCLQSRLVLATDEETAARRTHAQSAAQHKA
jgi:hypothetical protein